MTTRLNRKLGDEDYAGLPADGKRYEVLDGELYVTPAPTPLHQRVSKRLLRRSLNERSKGRRCSLSRSFHPRREPRAAA